MGIINRTLDGTEQKEVIKENIVLGATGQDFVIHRAPRAQTISAAYATSIGLSGAPTGTLKLQRFVVGAGLTTIAISGALTVAAIGTSGAQSMSLPAAGSSLLNLAAGDVLVYTTGGSNAGTYQTLVQVVVQNLGDFKAWF